VLTVGTQLWRVHRQDRSGCTFKTVTANPYYGGGRFDSTKDDPYPYLYAAPGAQTALLETLARGIPFNNNGERLLRRASIAGQRVSVIELVRDLTLISLLTTADLALACQDDWLIRCPAAEYPQTRNWGHWLRAQATWAQGFIWPSSRDLDGRNLILFGDRCATGALREVSELAVDLDDAAGARWLNEQLGPVRIAVRPPMHVPAQPS
jgi:hypothetical protein